MPMYKYTVRTVIQNTHYVEADNVDDVKAWVLEPSENPKKLDAGRSHNPLNSITLESLEEVTLTPVSV